MGQEALESSSAVLQTAADHPSGGARISATSPIKKPDVACDTGFMNTHGFGRASQAQMQRGRIRLLMGETTVAHSFGYETRR